MGDECPNIFAPDCSYTTENCVYYICRRHGKSNFDANPANIATFK